jgi:hypothetical protein
MACDCTPWGWARELRRTLCSSTSCLGRWSLPPRDDTVPLVKRTVALVLVAFVLTLVEFGCFVTVDTRSEGISAETLGSYWESAVPRALLVAVVLGATLVRFARSALVIRACVSSAVLLGLWVHCSTKLFYEFVAGWSTFSRDEITHYVWASGRVQWFVGVLLWATSVVLSSMTKKIDRPASG